jgi:hypothetical protein
MAALWLPMANTVLRFQRDQKFGGVYTPPLKPTFTNKGWLDGTFQEDAEKYLNDTMGFHRSLVRLNNQIRFSAFNLGDSLREVGPHGQLFETDYFQPHFGVNFLGEDSIVKLVKQHRLVQDSMAKRGVQMLFVMCPSKARFMPEELPRHVMRAPKVPTNMEVVLREFKAQGIHHIDMNEWFIRMKGKTPYLLYPKTGIHWSNYGASVAMDSLVKRMEQLLGKDMYNVQIERYDTPDTLQPPDGDIAKAMNLIWEPPFTPMAYPVYANPVPDSTKFRPDVLTIGDSYYWNLFGYGATAKYFGKNQFWFYNKWGYEGSREYNVDDVFFQEEIESQDIILFFYTEPQLRHYTSDFIPRAYRIYTDPAYAARDIPVTEEEIQGMIANILRTPDWRASIEEKARKWGKPFEEQLRSDAIFVIKENRKK